ncbi:MAG TPA: glucose-6-phosphate dehydrogenase assembly protein OpcA [Bryobacteraceae bacterium]|nr:glucose-6-phosphate dehydrogenase assembly protein OpcA [Bryobacteraceae bacterium]
MSAVIFPAQPEQILKGLSKLWTSVGKEEKQQGRPTVLRACAMTLIVATDDSDTGFAASQTIADLMREHAGRGIVVTVSPSAARSLEARVLAQCWKPFGKAQQICSEQIEILARPDSWPTVDATLTGLTVADLPVIFWCRHKGILSEGATAEDRAGLEAVMDLATKVVVDLKGIEANHAMELLARWRGQRRVLADLEWTRLTAWREPLAHVFDNPERGTKFSAFHTVEIEHTDERLPLGALYLAGWLSSPRRAKVAFLKAEGYAPGIHRVRLVSEAETIVFERNSSECATLRSTNGRERKYPLSEPGLTALMTEELSLMGTDSAFDAAFVRAQELDVKS